MRLSNLLFIALLVGFFACGNNTTTEGQQAATTPVASNTATQLPPIPLDTLKYLFDNCDYIDYVFFYKNFSLNQAEKAAIQNAIRGVSAEAAVLNPNCKPDGRIFFQIDGQNASEADIYLQQGCVYYVFMVNNQPTYANKMTQEGVQFYINVFSMQEQGQQGQ